MTNTHNSPTHGPRKPWRWNTIIPAAGATAAGVPAAHNAAWAVGVGTAAGLFVAIREVLRR